MCVIVDFDAISYDSFFISLKTFVRLIVIYLSEDERWFHLNLRQMGVEKHDLLDRLAWHMIVMKCPHIDGGFCPYAHPEIDIDLEPNMLSGLCSHIIRDSSYLILLHPLALCLTAPVYNIACSLSFCC